MPVMTQQGRDMTEVFRTAASNAGISLRLALGIAYAESKLNERAERFGVFTAEAQAAEAAGDFVKLQSYIDAAWRDVSFGIAQRIVPYHWAGDHTQRVANVLGVRAAVFEDPERDVREMCLWLRDDYRRALGADLSGIGNDVELGAAIIYNAGHWPEPNEVYWRTHAGNIDNYRRGFAWADAKLAELAAEQSTGPGGFPVEEGSMTIEQRVHQLQHDADGNPYDRLGNGGVPYSEAMTWETDKGPMIFQQYWYAGILEYPVAPTADNPEGRDCLVQVEATVSAEVAARFRS